MRWILLVDTCGQRGEVALADLTPDGGGPAMMVAQQHLPDRETQERLLPAVQEVLRARALPPSAIDAVAVTNGPGSFTGIRIGLAAAKGLAEALCVPLVVVSRLAMLASAAGTEGLVEAWLDAGRGQVFRGRYQQGTCLGEDMVHGSDAAAVLAQGTTVVAQEAALQALLPNLLLTEPVGVRELLPLAAFAAHRQAFADTALADANYLRVPDAELALNARLAAAKHPDQL